MKDAKSRIREVLSTYGISIVGFGTVADRTSIPEIQTDFPRTIVFGFVLSKSVLATIQNKPTLLYKHHYKTVNWILDQTACHLVRYLETQNVRAIAIPASQVIDWEHRKGHVSHIILAREAGLGYIGRNGLLIHPVHGAQIRYVSVLTDLVFEPDTPLSLTCKSCRACIEMCPAHAISETGVDMHACYEQLNQFAGMRGIGQHICGVCVKVCDGKH